MLLYLITDCIFTALLLSCLVFFYINPFLFVRRPFLVHFESAYEEYKDSEI